MYPIPEKCPICAGELYAERLVCAQCGAALEGEFALPWLARLTSEQWAFVEMYLRSEGKLKRVQEELGLSYPTVRNRLKDVIRALGYEVGPEAEEHVRERATILDELARGDISVEEAVRLLRGRGE